MKIYRIKYIDRYGERCVCEIQAESAGEAQIIFYTHTYGAVDIISIVLVGEY